MRVTVHPRITQKRPSLTDDDVIAAFMGTLRNAPRLDTYPTQWIGVGLDGRNRLLQYVAIETGPDEWLVFHAMPATTRAMKEVGLK